MRIRNLLLHRATLRLSSLLVLLSLSFPSSALEDPDSVEVACPTFIAHIVLHDYDGAHAVTSISMSTPWDSLASTVLRTGSASAKYER